MRTVRAAKCGARKFHGISCVERERTKWRLVLRANEVTDGVGHCLLYIAAEYVIKL